MAGSSANGGTIKLFKFTQKIYQDIGIVPDEGNQKRSYVYSKDWVFILSHAQFFATTVAHFFFATDSMIEYGMGFFSVITLLTCNILYLIPYLESKNTFNFIRSCEQFIEKKIHSTNVYKDANEKIERLTELFSYAMFVTTINLTIPSLLYTIVGYYILDSGKESFFLFYPTWWPFDWKTPFGYLVAWLAECSGLAAIIMTTTPFYNMVFGSCYLFIVMVEDITNDVAAFNKTIKTQKHSDCVETMNSFCDIIQTYLDTKQCFNDFKQMNKYTLFTFFVWDMLSISSALISLQFQLWDDNARLLEIMILSMVLMLMFEYDLIICESGERVSNEFSKFGVELERCSWSHLSIKMQRMYLIFLSDTQQPNFIQSYGGITCTRDTFKKITTNGFSYFTTFRNFGE